MLSWFAGDRFPLYLAPMAGFTDQVFRGLCKRLGADVVVTEFVMANRFFDPRGRDTAWRLIDFTPEQRPMGVQIFGSDPKRMGEAARMIVDRLQPDFLDINYGCPSARVVDQCAGSSLLRDLPRLAEVARGVVSAIDGTVPVTAKIRIGWDRSSIVAVEAGRLLEDEGIQALAVHGRTKEQGYTGDADWETIGAVAEALRIPVIGNGSITSAADVQLRRSTTAVRGLMIGRAALGYPWIFREIKHTLATGQVLPPPSLEERWEVLLDYARELMDNPPHDGLWKQMQWMRSRLKSFTKMIPGCRKLRCRLETVSTFAELQAIADEHLATHHASID
jgi:tRNA-dihydrouridine synthase B